MKQIAIEKHSISNVRKNAALSFIYQQYRKNALTPSKVERRSLRRASINPRKRKLNNGI